MTTVIKTHKSNSAGLWIALAVSAVLAMAVAFYLNMTGKDDAAHVAEAPAAAVAEVSSAAPTSAAPVVHE
jgi:flagellar basal body-associated protein FliL